MSQPKPSVKQRLTELEKEVIQLKSRIYICEQILQQMVDADLVSRAAVEAAFREMAQQLLQRTPGGLTLPKSAHIERPKFVWADSVKDRNVDRA